MAANQSMPPTKRFIDHLIRSDAVEMGSARLASGVPRPYVFTVAAGILPAVEPGIHPPQCDGGFGPARRIVARPWHHQLSKGLCYGGRVLPGGNGVLSGKALSIWRRRPGGKMPPSTAAKMAAATHLVSRVNTYPMGEGRGEGEFAPKSKIVFARVLNVACLAQSPPGRLSI